MVRVTEVATGPGSLAYGMGLARLYGFTGHGGELPGYNSFMGSDPVHGLTVVLWANVVPTRDGIVPAEVLQERVLPLLRGEA